MLPYFGYGYLSAEKNQILLQICIKFGANLASKLKKKYVKRAPSNGDIWDEFSEQHQHQSIKKSKIFKARLEFFFANKVQSLMHILVGTEP